MNFYIVLLVEQSYADFSDFELVESMIFTDFSPEVI